MKNILSNLFHQIIDNIKKIWYPIIYDRQVIRVSFRKMMLIITGIIITVFLISLSASYAWYSYSGGATDFNSVLTEADLNIIYAQSKIITTTTSLPINDIDKEKYAEANIFTVSSPKDLQEYQILLTISLINIEIDEELKSKDFKYELLQDNVVINSGTGLDFDSNTKVLKETLEIDPTKSYTFALRVWLSETGESQNELMNKSFKAQIQVDSVAKR